VLACRLRLGEHTHRVCLLLVLLLGSNHHPLLLLLLRLWLGHTLLLPLERSHPLLLPLPLPGRTHPRLLACTRQLACSHHHCHLLRLLGHNPHLLLLLLLGHTHHLLLLHLVDYMARHWPLGCTTYDRQLWGCREQTAAPPAHTRT
jgi:hypothetical protein